MPKRPTVLVVGSGRSGTSTVGKILHEELGICMGHFLRPPGPMNPGGFYEDYLSHGMVRMMRTGDLTPNRYLEVMNGPGSHCDCKMWGAKDPWFLYLNPDYMKAIKPDLCIICIRPFEATMNSWARLTGGWKSQAHYKSMEALTQERHYLATEVVGKYWPIMKINFNQKKDPEELRENIRYMLKIQKVPGF